MATTSRRTAPVELSETMRKAYRRDGFVKVPGLIGRDEALAWREAALAASEREKRFQDGAVFTQLVNVWLRDDSMRGLTLDPRLASAAEQLAGAAMRLWHDHLLIKQPHNDAPTEFHQDQPYWPHRDAPDPISCWLALGDVPARRGCMSFIPGSHRHTDLPAQDLRDAGSLFGLRPALEFEPQVTLPLRAGDATFHHGRCAHMATPNRTDQARVAHVVIFMNEGARLGDKKGHPALADLEVEPGEPLAHARFPRAADIAACEAPAGS